MVIRSGAKKPNYATAYENMISFRNYSYSITAMYLNV
jgi:hypothetical protein